MVYHSRMLMIATAVLVASCEARTGPFTRSATTLTKQVPTNSKLLSSWTSVPRGGDVTAAATEAATTAATAAVTEVLSPSKISSVANIVVEATSSLKTYFAGPKTDALLLLLTTTLITPLCQLLGTSPILGFLATGLLLGPNGKGCISDVHTTEMLADLGIVFFLFEMGIHLSFDTLMKMRRNVFGLGGSQFILTAIAVAGISTMLGLSSAAAIVIGGALALSSSAFVLQLLKDKDELQTNFGKTSFGVLLLQDLAVVPLLVVTPILAGGGGGVLSAFGSAGVKALMSFSAIAVIGKFLLNPLFELVEKSKSQEAFWGAILTTVLSMSFLTEGLGLSNTLGAFLAGVLLADTKFRHRIETEISPIRGILVGLFFFTVGFEIDLGMIASKFPLVAGIVAGILVLKTVIATAVCLAFGVPFSTSQRAGLILSQGGEFAFVAFRLAREVGVMDNELTKLMLTCVSLTMGLTPFLEDLGGRMALKLESKETDTKKPDKKKPDNKKKK